jgi:hypothetical protein
MINIGIGIAWSFRKLSKYVSNLILSFKERVSLDNGVFEAGQCLNEDLSNLQGIGLLQKASLVITPNAIKEGKLYSVVPSNGSGDLTVVRATTATRVDGNNLVEAVPYNLLSYSNTFSNSSWSKTSVTVTGGQVGYDGTSNAWLLSNTATSGAYLSQSVSLSVNSTFSAYLKKGTLDFAMFLTSGSSIVIFNLANGTINSSTGCSATIESVGNGWYKCSMKPTFSGNNVRIYPGNNSGAPVGNVLLQNTQLLISSSLKDYFPTTDRLNVPRLDYTNSTCPSILVEPQRTNLCTRSEEFNDITSWSSAAISVSTNSINSPGGIKTADTITPANTLTNHWIGKTSFTLTSGSVYSYSVYAKNNGYNLVISVGSNTIYTNCNFNLSNGTVSTPFATPGANLCTATISNVGNGWYRCTVSFTAFMTLNFLLFSSNNTNLTPTGTFGMANMTGDGVSGFYLWGAQLELGSNATSYIPTTSATVTRNADVISKTGISSLIGQTEGTIFANCFINISDTTSTGICGISGTGLNFIYLFKQSGNLLRANVYTTSQQASLTYTFPSSSFYKIAFKYKQNDFSLFINGVKISNSNSGNVPACSVFNFYDISLGINPMGIYKTSCLFKTALTDAECIALTTL